MQEYILFVGQLSIDQLCNINPVREQMHII